MSSFYLKLIPIQPPSRNHKYASGKVNLTADARGYTHLLPQLSACNAYSVAGNADSLRVLFIKP